VADEIGRANLLHTKEESCTSELVLWACFFYSLRKIGFRIRPKRISAGALCECAESARLCKSSWLSRKSGDRFAKSIWNAHFKTGPDSFTRPVEGRYLALCT